MSAEESAPAYRNPHYLIPQLYILGGVEFIVCFVSLCYSLYIYKTDKQITSKHVLKYMNFFGILSFLCCDISQCINIYYWNVYYWQYSTTQTITWYLTWLFWSCGIFMSYLLFLNRITTTFKQSTFEPSAKTIYYLYSLLFIYGLLWIIACFSPVFTYLFHNITRSLIFKVEFIISIPITIFDILITCSMIYIFVSRLYKLILMQTSMIYNEQYEILNISLNEFDSTRMRMSLLWTSRLTQMMKVSVKISILTITSLTSSFILITLRSISFFLSYKSPLAKCAAMWMQFDTIISCLCLLLFLPKTQKGFD
eukprot:202468_1